MCRKERRTSNNTAENEKILRQSHDRLTCGDNLSLEETAQVEAWYAREDAAETLSLNLPSAPEPTNPEPTNKELAAHIAASENELRLAVERLQTISAQNEAIRREIVKLQAEAERRFALTPYPAYSVAA